MNKYEKENVERRITSERIDAAEKQYHADKKRITEAHISGTQKGILFGAVAATIFYGILIAAAVVLKAWGMVKF